jgi:ubiquinone/menaquinone biosynthesis C-methylase UbiE
VSAGDDAAERRAEVLDAWERVAAGWGRRAGETRTFGMPVSSAMIERLRLQPGQRVLELAAGPGDTGFLAAELVQPGGTLICSDAAEGMLAVARARAEELGIRGVEFKRLELEWIDLETATVDAALCRWGVMLSLDPEAAMREIRRVVRPGGRAAIAVWDVAEANPWATIITDALVAIGAPASRERSGRAGMFALADGEALVELFGTAGFSEVTVETVEVIRSLPSVTAFLEQSRDISLSVVQALEGMPETQQAKFAAALEQTASPYVDATGTLTLPGRSLVAAGEA